jgi:hypothetical protein
MMNQSTATNTSTLSNQLSLPLASAVIHKKVKKVTKKVKIIKTKKAKVPIV